MTAQTPISARTSARWTPALIKRVETELASYDWSGSNAYQGLSELAQSVEITGYTVDLESAVVDGEFWLCPGSVFVTLRYDVKSKEPVEIEDSYPISVKFKPDSNSDSVSIDSIEVDTSSFFE